MNMRGFLRCGYTIKASYWRMLRQRGVENQKLFSLTAANGLLIGEKEQ
jgi:hypothetical protein